MKIKVIKKRVLEAVSDFFEEVYDSTFGQVKLKQAKNIGERLAVPKKYYSRELSDKEISKLGIPYYNTKDGGTIFINSYRYNFQGRERTTNVITNLGRDNKIVKSVIQTPGMVSCYRLEGKKIPAYHVTHVFNNQGKKQNHICRLENGDAGTSPENIMHIFSSTTDDGLKLDIKRYIGGCACVGEPGERLVVDIGPKDRLVSIPRYFSGDDRFKNAAAHIENVRATSNSLRSKYVRKHTLSPYCPNKTIIIN